MLYFVFAMLCTFCAASFLLGMWFVDILFHQNAIPFPHISRVLYTKSALLILCSKVSFIMLLCLRNMCRNVGQFLVKNIYWYLIIFLGIVFVTLLFYIFFTFTKKKIMSTRIFVKQESFFNYLLPVSLRYSLFMTWIFPTWILG